MIWFGLVWFWSVLCGVIWLELIFYLVWFDLVLVWFGLVGLGSFHFGLVRFISCFAATRFISGRC